MHPNPAFRATPEAEAIAFARRRSFGILALNGAEGPLLAHIPFLLDDTAGSADLHLVRSNPILALLTTPQPAAISIQGPDGYVSPDWYGVPDQVPTWNYVAVHLRGRLERLPDGAMHDMLDRQAAQFEPMLLPKPPWTTRKMTPDVLQRMMRQIAPCRLSLARVDSTWKIGQNKSGPVRRSAALQMARHGIGQDVASLASLMDSGREQA